MDIQATLNELGEQLKDLQEEITQISDLLTRIRMSLQFDAFQASFDQAKQIEAERYAEFKKQSEAERLSALEEAVKGLLIFGKEGKPDA